jgi:hypothetical protein
MAAVDWWEILPLAYSLQGSWVFDRVLASGYYPKRLLMLTACCSGIELELLTDVSITNSFTTLSHMTSLVESRLRYD